MQLNGEAGGRQKYWGVWGEREPPPLQRGGLGRRVPPPQNTIGVYFLAPKGDDAVPDDGVEAGASAEWLHVERSGKCSGRKNLKRLKLENAIEYGFVRGLTAGDAVDAMHADDVAADEIPTDDQIKWQRKKLLQHQKGNNSRCEYTATCCASMEFFIKHPPPGVTIVCDPPERCTVSSDRMRVCFVIEAAMELTLNLDLHSFVMDFTFNTNREGLLLGCIGNIGLWSRGLLPHMRFLHFLLWGLLLGNNSRLLLLKSFSINPKPCG
jgi:hypothetical protein